MRSHLHRKTVFTRSELWIKILIPELIIIVTAILYMAYQFKHNIFTFDGIMFGLMCSIPAWVIYQVYR